jgi:hypothetical protein
MRRTVRIAFLAIAFLVAASGIGLAGYLLGRQSAAPSLPIATPTGQDRQACLNARNALVTVLDSVEKAITNRESLQLGSPRPPGAHEARLSAAELSVQMIRTRQVSAPGPLRTVRALLLEGVGKMVDGFEDLATAAQIGSVSQQARATTEIFEGVTLYRAAQQEIKDATC